MSESQLRRQQNHGTDRQTDSSDVPSIDRLAEEEDAQDGGDDEVERRHGRRNPVLPRWRAT